MPVCIHSNVGLSLVLTAVHTAHMEQTHSDVASCHGAEDQERQLLLSLKLTCFMASGRPFNLPVSVVPICKHGMDDSCMKLSFRGLLKGLLKEHLCPLDKTKILLCKSQNST